MLAGAEVGSRERRQAVRREPRVQIRLGENLSAGQRNLFHVGIGADARDHVRQLFDGVRAVDVSAYGARLECEARD